MPTIELFYDLRSPYAFFSACDLHGMSALGGRVIWRAASIHMLLNLQRGRDPLAPYEDPLPPVKRAYLMHDVRREARRRGIKMRTPASLQSRLAMQLCLGLEGSPDEAAFRERLWTAIWLEGMDVSDPAILLTCAGQIGPACEERAAVLLRADYPDALVRRSEAAFASGIFGVPSFLLDGEVFFGSDRLKALIWRLDAAIED